MQIEPWWSRALPALLVIATGCSSPSDGARTPGSGGSTSSSGGVPSSGAASTGGVTSSSGGVTSSSGGATGSGGGTTMPPPGGARVVGYYPSWATYDRNFQVADIRAPLLTHVNYAFANVSASGECELGDAWADVQKAFPGDDSADSSANRAGNFNQLRALRAANPGLRTLISVGGWTWSDRFSDVALTDASRKKFAASCAAFARAHGFDGLDLDWEYPVEGGEAGNVERPEDAANFVLLLQALRAALDAAFAGSADRPLLTIAAAASPKIFEHQDLAKVAEPLDWINLMTYDYNGGWTPFAAHNAPLAASPADPSTDPVQKTRFNVTSTAQSYLDAGVPPAKLSLGVPFYGRGWSGVPPGANGLFQTASGQLPQGTWEAGVYDYADLAANYVGKDGFTRHWDEACKVPYLYSPSTQEFISYDDVESIRLKAAFARETQLGGVMVWDLSSDARPSWPLLEAVNAGLSGAP